MILSEQTVSGTEQFDFTYEYTDGWMGVHYFEPGEIIPDPVPGSSRSAQATED